MTKLSPQAQAVLDAAFSAYWVAWVSYKAASAEQEAPNDAGIIAAAALRAAADQVVPDHANSVGDAHDDARRDQWMRIRRKLLAIAAELEGGND